MARADVFLACAALILLAVGVCLKTRAFHRIAIGGVTALVLTLIMTLQQDNSGDSITLFGDMLVYDRFGVFMKVLVSIGAISAIFYGCA